MPEVITDVLVAQDRMREAIRDVELALMVSTMLHSIATGNLLPVTTPQGWQCLGQSSPR